MADRTFAGLSYDAVLQKYADTVAGVCVMRLQNWADAEDCFQNTFIKLFQKSPDFQDENHLKAWLIKVAVNECNNYMKKNRRTISIESLKEQPSYHSEDEMDITWALMKLPPNYRDILYLHYCERYKVKEIAKILGKNPNTVMVMLKRGREMLRKVYGGDEA